MSERRRITALDVGQWLAHEEPDDVNEHGEPTGPPKTIWRLRGRGNDEVQATWAGVLVCLECTYLDEVDGVFAAAKRRQQELYRMAVDMGVTEELER